jgi:hypothetical protein
MASAVLDREAGQESTAKDGKASSRWIGSRPHLRRRSFMKSINVSEFELEIGIEELEPRVAPDGGETVLPLPKPHHHK